MNRRTVEALTRLAHQLGRHEERKHILNMLETLDEGHSIGDVVRLLTLQPSCEECEAGQTYPCTNVHHGPDNAHHHHWHTP